MSLFESPILKEIKAEAQRVEAAVTSSPLWHDVYEHRGAALGTVAGAAVATAVVCSRSERFLRFLSEADKVLMLEDTTGMAKALRVGLENQGLQVSHYRGANGDPLWGKMRLGSLPLRPLKYRFALVDGDLGPKSLTGDQIIPRLRKENPGIFVLGTSSQPEMNADMLKAGADLVAKKEVAVGVLAHNDLSLNQALQLRENSGAEGLMPTQQKLDLIAKGRKNPEYKEIWASGRTLVEKHMFPMYQRLWNDGKAIVRRYF